METEYNLVEMRRRQCHVPTQNNIVGTRHCRLLACHSGATGIDMTSVQRFKNMPQTTRFPIKTLHQIKRY